MSDQFWERLAQSDPLWAVLSDPSKRGRQWDVGLFFETGRREISLLMHQLRVLGCTPARGTALDFGCGVGRLSQALAQYFEHVVGLDVAPTMIAIAERLNRYGTRVTYVENHDPHLSRFGFHGVDLVYSDIVLQHIEPDIAAIVVEEFCRILRPNGIAVFQLPSHKRPQGRLDRSPQPMPDEAYRASIEILGGVDTLRAGGAHDLRLSIVNESPLPWTEGALRVGNHWRDATSFEMLVQDDGRSKVAGPLAPRQRVSVPLTITAPGFPGDYICEVDLVHEGIAWFADKGNPTRTFAVSVREGAMTTSMSPNSATRTNHQELPVSIGDIYGGLPPYHPVADEFPMFGIPQERVGRIVSANGGRIILEEPDERCGREWIGFRYFVQKAG
jgi:SAM-dependent methyltransferase